MKRDLSARESLQGGLGDESGPLADVETLGFRVDKEGSAVSVRVELGFSAGEPASRVEVLESLLRYEVDE